MNPINPMSINNPGAGDPLDKTERAASSPSLRGHQRSQKAEVQTGDVVALSSLAQDLQAVRAHLDSPDAVRAARVAALARSVAEGTYQVQSGKIAEKLLNL